MEESLSAHTCQTNYNDFNNMSHRDSVKFRRCLGNVKLSQRPEEGVLTGDEFDVIIDKIQDVNEDVFLTRECNNFDLITPDCSLNSLHSTQCYTQSDLNKHKSLMSVESKFSSALDSSSSIGEASKELADKTFNSQDHQPENSDLTNKNLNSQSFSDKYSLSTDSQSDLTSDILSQQAVLDSAKNVISIKRTVTPKFHIENPPLTMTPATNEDYLSVSPSLREVTTPSLEEIDYNHNDEVDSDDSSKWDNKIDDATYDARYFYNSENFGGDHCDDECRRNIKKDISDDGSATLIKTGEKTETIENEESNSLEKTEFLNDSFENDSIKSQGTSKSTSSAFESAMSSNDMMSPFGTPRNSLSKHSSVSARSVKKKLGFNFASLTSENIPNTLNRLSMHRACDKNFSKSIASAIEKKQRELNSNDIFRNKFHSCQGIKKLLNLTSEKKCLKQKETRAIARVSSREKVPAKKGVADDNRLLNKDSIKSISLKSRENKMNIKEFYSSKRKKIKSLVETEQLNTHLSTFYHENTGSKEPKNESKNQNIAKPLKFKSIIGHQDKVQNPTQAEDIETVVEASREAKSKFVSKIPRPVSRREVLKSSDQDSNELDTEENYQLECSSSSNLAAKSNKSDKSDTTHSRPSDGSESSFNQQSHLSKLLDEKSNYKNGSKIGVNNSQIDSLRSKYWMKEEKIKPPTLGCFPTKKENKMAEIKQKDDKKVKSIMNVGFQSFRQESRITYGKIVRVKTAPLNKSTIQMKEKSLLREPSRADAAFSWKSGNRKPSKVVSIGALDVNKIT